MNIREATGKDIPEIVEVLKASLGEDQLQLSEEVWRYKHINNPFGKSIVLVAIENGQIIGIRAFMRWQWQQGEKQFSALRAVDTATHPEHQGKGIFKKLTLKAVKLAGQNGDHFIFNTPNEKSRPGYLKMGWEQVGKINIGIKPSLGFLKFKKPINDYSISKQISQHEIDELCHKWIKNLTEKPRLFTPKTAEMLKWRYEENPLQAYEIIADSGYYLACYVKNKGRLKELRITECIFDQQTINLKEIKRIIKVLEDKFKPHLISYSPKLLQLSGREGNFGPVLTFNSLNLMDSDKRSFSKIENWNYSVGDLELF